MFGQVIPVFGGVLVDDYFSETHAAFVGAG